MKQILITLTLAVTSTVCSLAATPQATGIVTNDTVTTKKNTKAYSDSTAFFKELHEVVVESSNVKTIGNEDIVTVSRKMRRGTGDAAELMGRLPGAFYNPATRELLYLGSKNIIILVDSIEKDASYIKTLNPIRFDRINVVRNPQGKYSGYDALINLHTKSNYEGYEGNFHGMLKYNPTYNGKGNEIQTLHLPFSFTWTHNKINLYAKAEFFRVHEGKEEAYEKYYPLNNYKETILSNPNNKPNTTYKSGGPRITAGMDWQINKAHSISIEGIYYNVPNQTNRHLMLMQENTETGSEQIIDQYNHQGSLDYNQWYGGLWYRGRAGAWRVSATMTGSYLTFNKENELIQSTGFSLRDFRKARQTYLSPGADASRTFFGGKSTLTLSDYAIFYNYNEQIAGGNAQVAHIQTAQNRLQLQLGWWFGNKASISASAGIYTLHQKDLQASNTFFSPRINLQGTWNPSGNVSLSLVYAMTPRAASMDQVESYGLFTDSLVWQSGNPDLKPQQSHGIWLTARFWRWLTVAANYNLSRNAPYQIITPGFGERPDGISGPYARRIWENGTGTNWTVNITGNRNITPRVTLNGTFTLQGLRASYGDQMREKVIPTYSWWVMWTTPDYSWYVLAGETLQTAFPQTGTGVKVTPQERKWEFEDNINIMINRTFFNHKLVLGLTWILPVHFWNCRQKGTLESEAIRMRYMANNTRHNYNMLDFQVIYRFSGGKSIRQYNRVQGEDRF